MVPGMAPGGWITDVGAVAANGSAPDNPIGYGGYTFNAASGEYLVRHRSYEPELGRFLQRDPSGYADGMSLYLYASASPWGMLDPMGLNSGMVADPAQIEFYRSVANDPSAYGPARELARRKLYAVSSREYQLQQNIEQSQRLAAAQNREHNSRLARLEGGLQITGNALSFGLTDAAGLTRASQFRGSTYAASRVLAYTSATAAHVVTGGAIVRGASAALAGSNTVRAGIVSLQLARGMTAGAEAAIVGRNFAMAGYGAAAGGGGVTAGLLLEPLASQRGRPNCPIYPPSGGVRGHETEFLLRPGQRIDRYGMQTGTYFAPLGTPMPMRSLRPGSSQEYHAYEVVKPLPVWAGHTAPYYGQPGGGVQFRTRAGANELVPEYLRPVSESQ